MPEVTFGPEEFAARTHVSRETLKRLAIYAEFLTDWNSRHNLIAASTLGELWHRHMWDSAQLAPLIPGSARTLADLGSGAGFPGLVLAAMRPDLDVTLFEATAKKCAFLREASHHMNLPVKVCNTRIEQRERQTFDVITARALAPLPKLLEYAFPFTSVNSVCLFLKGQNLAVELTEASKYWNMKISQVASQTHPSAAILIVRELDPLNVAHAPSQKAARSGRRQPKGRGR